MPPARSAATNRRVALDYSAIGALLNAALSGLIAAGGPMGKTGRDLRALPPDPGRQEKEKRRLRVGAGVFRGCWERAGSLGNVVWPPGHFSVDAQNMPGLPGARVACLRRVARRAAPKGRTPTMTSMSGEAARQFARRALQILVVLDPLWYMSGRRHAEGLCNGLLGTLATKKATGAAAVGLRNRRHIF